ncbi:ABC transporter permease [Frigoribacterium sp. UYMn621]|uniref:ABC transporter permease n=1 Tax=Frigoribacterium sp. UYMn621 TaxID=3156343 RepID=UPI003394CBEF
MTTTMPVEVNAALDSRAKDRRSVIVRRSAAPVLVALLLLSTFLWVSSLQLDSIEQRTLNPVYIAARIREHLVLTIVASALVAVLAIPAGILVHRVRSKVFRSIVLVVGNIGQATPAVGVVILLAIVWQTGFATALVALVAYSFLPTLRNTMIGLAQVSPDAREAARGMGMTPGQVLRQIELPLATPTIFAGLRTSLVFAVGVATVATFINAGGLGDMIVNGLKLQRFPVLLVGSVLVAAIAILIDWLAGIVEDIARPRGL